MPKCLRFMDSKAAGTVAAAFWTALKPRLCFEPCDVLQHHPEKPSSLDLKVSGDDGKSPPPLGVCWAGSSPPY